MLKNRKKMYINSHTPLPTNKSFQHFYYHSQIIQFTTWPLYLNYISITYDYKKIIISNSYAIFRGHFSWDVILYKSILADYVLLAVVICRKRHIFTRVMKFFFLLPLENVIAYHEYFLRQALNTGILVCYLNLQQITKIK